MLPFVWKFLVHCSCFVREMVCSDDFRKLMMYWHLCGVTGRRPEEGQWTALPRPSSQRQQLTEGKQEQLPPPTQTVAKDSKPKVIGETRGV